MGHEAQLSGTISQSVCWLRFVLLFLLLTGSPSVTCSQEHPEPATSELIGVLAKEKSLAEEFARLLKDQGRANAAQYVQSIRLYSLAKAKFDGLIEQMAFAFQTDEPPNTSPEFHVALQSAVESRVAFTDIVDKIILSKQPPGTRFAIGDFIKGSADLIKAISDATFTAWRDYRTTAEARKRDIIARLDTYKWRPFGKSPVGNS